MKPVVFDDEARAEFAAAAAYYEAQRAGLGADFVAEVERAAQRIGQTPQAFPPYAHGARKCVLRRFPYTVYFLELGDRVWIAAVAHQRRRPSY